MGHEMKPFRKSYGHTRRFEDDPRRFVGRGALSRAVRAGVLVPIIGELFYVVINWKTTVTNNRLL